MNTQRMAFYRKTFLVAGVYDVVLGTLFVFFNGFVYGLLGIRDRMPDTSYLALLGAFVFVIGVAYFLIARRNLEENRDLIAVGLLYKVAYCVVGFVYFFMGEVPHIAFVLVFGVIDFIFAVIMARCWFEIRSPV